MPISKRLASAVALVLVAACNPLGTGGANSATVAVAGRNVTVMAPPGFCVDPASTNTSASGAFVMVSDCALLGGPPPEGDGETIGAVMTASISADDRAAPGAQPHAAIRRLAETVEGRAILGRSGRGDRVRILATRSRADVLYMLIEDRGPQPVEGVEPRFWRAFLEVQGKTTVLSVLGFQGAGVGPTEGLAYLQAFADHVQAANRG